MRRRQGGKGRPASRGDALRHGPDKRRLPAASELEPGRRDTRLLQQRHLRPRPEHGIRTLVHESGESVRFKPSPAPTTFDPFTRFKVFTLMNLFWLARSLARFTSSSGQLKRPIVIVVGFFFARSGAINAGK